MAATAIQKYSQTIGERTEVDDIMTIVLLIQRFFGHHILDPQWTWRNFYYYQILNLLMFTYVLFGTLEIIKTNASDIELVAEACLTLVLLTLCPIKLMLFIGSREDFRYLYLAIKTTLLSTIKQNTGETESVLKKVRKAVYGLLGMFAMPVSFYELAALYNYIKGNRILLSRSAATLLPFTSPYYEISWFIHSIFLTEVTTIIMVIDMWLIFLMHFLSLASDCLVKVLEVKPQRDDEETCQYSMRLNMHLRQFHVTHLELVEFLNKLSRMFKWLAVIPLLNVAMCICVVLVVISKETNLKMVPHVINLLAEIFAFSWFGEQIKTKMENLELALHNFDWLHLEKKHKMNYIIIVTYMQKSFGIKTALGNDLSLITMTQVLKGSYQAYTVMQTVD